MKIITKPLVALFLLSLTIGANAQNFVEGTHYEVINTAKSLRTESDKYEIVEYFSFSCPGCYGIEPSIKAVLKSLPDVNVRRVHMPFGGRAAKNSQKVFALLETLDAGKHKDAVFVRIHRDQNPFDSDKEIVQFFESLGYEAKKIESALSSFSLDMLIRTMNNEAKKMRISSVPTIIIDGKYQVIVRQVNTGADLVALTRFLRDKVE